MEKSMEARMEELETKVAHLTQSKETMEKFIEKVEGLLEAFQALQGAWKVLEFIGKLAKPIAFLGAFLGALSLYWSKLKS